MSPREWLATGTEVFLRTVAALPDEHFADPSGLPGWRRAHVVAHVHHNAEALRRLVRWAATGVEHRMYRDAAQRQAEIDHGATLSPGELRTLLHRSATALAADLAALSETAWRRPVVTAQGRTVPATEIPWLRAREVWVHAVDLACGVGFADLPPDFLTALVTEVSGRHATGAHAAELAEWLTGRGDTAPALGRWL
ncbi:maleylpyruvate isomerase [Crossiella equi]|uniref:Maleylpyruvate isomerase n=1 Tax=Crossiella equi TaxID=130796 RepID=A0ABS5A6S9_9PSEU|nr:maleylpyruvate isomerase family mycothiol-dependent enzyme [Crossiella equi]MBP2472303.1 maleylpyruvate isomerase [Crossiella equi]